MRIPICLTAFGQNGEPNGAPERSKSRINRNKVTFADSHSMVRMVFALTGFLKVPA
ncbi:MAG: hypothetical protein ACD_54C00271G0001 [uncultured bacterium]|nr:MAG: hypothetical protein ACD_54C00271G0001 [uncultured bacterium]